MAQTETVHINFTGGIVSPGYLKEVLEMASSAKVTHVSFGLRQQLILDIPLKHLQSFSKSCNDKNISFSIRENAFPNIVSSYPASGIFTTDSWLREGVYKDIFNSFDYAPKSKINISDSKQNLVPFFTGHVNWISSLSSHFWYLYIRFPKSQTVFCFPELIYTNDISLLSKRVEEILLQTDIRDENEMCAAIKTSLSYISKPVEEDLKLPAFSLPYYEGFNKYDNNYWLGIYRRDELYPVTFLIDACSVCIDTKIGQLYTTPWKSIIVKGIDIEDRKYWDHILGRYRINVRHAANELNWQVEDDNEEGLMLKRHVIRSFDKDDVRTYGLCFAVQIKPHSGMFGSIIIRKQEVKNPDKLKSLERFEILYTSNFNPNSFVFTSYRKNVEKDHVATYLVSLCKLFYQQQSETNTQAIKDKAAPTALANSATGAKTIYQCTHCYTIYDEAVGDVDNNIKPATAFTHLPASYKCALCDAEKEAYAPVEEAKLYVL